MARYTFLRRQMIRWINMHANPNRNPNRNEAILLCTARVRGDTNDLRQESKAWKRLYTRVIYLSFYNAALVWSQMGEGGWGRGDGGNIRK